MAEAFIGLPDRLLDSGHEFDDIVDIADIGLDHRELVAAEPRDHVGIADTAPEAGGHQLQQLVADMMSEQVVDALEFVDVDIEQCELPAAAGHLQLVLDPFAEQHPVRQVGERVVMRQMRDLLVGAPPLGDVLDHVDDIAGLAVLIADSRCVSR